MRRYVALLILVGLFGVIPASALAPCTITGTQQRNILQGTPGPDFICARGGDDYANGHAGDDVIRGGAGNDTLVGGPGHDRLAGRKGSDRLVGIDGQPLDTLNGKSGLDQCYVDIGDVVKNCDSIRVSHSLLQEKLLLVKFTPGLEAWMEHHGYDDDDG